MNLLKVGIKRPIAVNKQFLNLVTWQGFQNGSLHRQLFWNVQNAISSKPVQAISMNLLQNGLLSKTFHLNVYKFLWAFLFNHLED